MKNRISKIMGAALTLVLALTLAVGFLPVYAPAAEAGELEWDTLTWPKVGEDGSWFWDQNITDLGPIAKAIDGTLYLWVEGTGADLPQLIKSTDGGRKWSKLRDFEDLDAGNVVAIACSPEDADALWVASDDTVYRTTNAGRSFTALTDTTSDGTLTAVYSLSVGYVDDERYLFIAGDGGGVTDDVYSLGPSYGATWEAMDIDEAGAANIYRVAAAPDFNSAADPLLLAIVDDGTDVLVYFKMGGGAWNGNIGPGSPDSDPDAGILYAIADGTPIASDFGFPENFESDPEGDLEFFVSVANGDDTDDSIWRIVVDSVFGTMDDDDVYTIAVAGDVGDASLLAGTTMGSVHYSTNNGDSWNEAKKEARPSGDSNVSVLMSDDYMDSEEAWAATEGTTDDSDVALSFTMDGGQLWTQISVIDTDKESIDNINFTRDYSDSSGDLFVVTTPEAGNDSLWMYSDGNFERVDCQPEIDLVQVSPEWESDSTVFWADMDDAQIYRATDGGIRFKAQLGNPDYFMSWIVIDDSTLIVGGDGEVFKTTNNGTRWETYDAGLETAGNIRTWALSPDYAADETILCGDDIGNVFMSTNGGEDWKSVTKGTEEFDTGGLVYVAFDPEYGSNETYYAAGDDDSGNGQLIVSRYTDEWEVILDNDKLETGDGFATGLICSADAALYATHSGMTGMARALSPRISDTDKVAWDHPTEDFNDVALAGLRLTAGSNILWGQDGFYDDGWENGDSIWWYEDTLNVPVVLSSPSDGTTSGRTDEVTLSWNDLDGADEYQIKWGTDPGLNSDYTYDYTETTSITLRDLYDGTTYYWKVRVNAGEPIRSRYSETWSFTTALGEPEWNPFKPASNVAPSPGATDVQLTPTFQWNPADWATGYEFVLAKDSAYSDTLVSKTGANALTATVYLSEQTLENSTTYYWKVRAISKTSDSEWAEGVFTTMAAPPTPPAPPAPPPEPEPPTTPVYIWVIIGIGAALVIAVIILIVRTRRVA